MKASLRSDCLLALLFFGIHSFCHCQSVSINLVPPKLPRATPLGSFSPPIEFSYSGLETGIFQFRTWLLETDPPDDYLFASNQWRGLSIANIDNSDGTQSSGIVTVVSSMDVFDYGSFVWVIGLFDSTGAIELARDERHCDATLNRPPVLNSIGDQTVATGEPMVLSLSASDPDGPSPVFAGAGLPPGASLDPNSGVFSWVPTTSGTYPGIRLSAVDLGDGPLVDSEEITITVVDKPRFTAQPDPMILEVGQSGSMEASATAAPEAGAISFQWLKDEAPLAGETSNTLLLTSVGPSDAGTYRVVASNDVGSTTSGEAFLIVPVPRTNEETRNLLLEYLASVQDEFHWRYEVYRDLDSPGNHFHARGFIPDEDAMATNDGAWLINPHSGATCMRFTFERDDTGQNFAGIYLMNGALINGAPVPYFGEDQLEVEGTLYQFVDSGLVDAPDKRSFRGINLSGATKLVFHARGEVGGEQIEFFVGGVGFDDPIKPHPDSTSPVPLAQTPTTLTTEWTRFEIDLTGADLSDIKGAFGWVANAQNNPNPVTIFYIDDVYFELTSEAREARLAEPRFLRSFTTLEIQPDWSPEEAPPFELVFRSTASIYDQIIALLAFLSSNTEDGLRRACIIADALVYAAHHHRSPKIPGSTNLRGFSKFYKAGDIALPPGWEIEGLAATVPSAGIYHEGTQTFVELQESSVIDTGENLWCVVGLLAMFEATGRQDYLDTALIAAEQAHVQRQDAGTYQGFIAGPEEIHSGTPVPRTYRSTEHHLDAVAAFRKLHEITHDPKWLDDANHALVFVEQMWDASRGCYLTGTSTEPNPQPNYGTLPQDVQSWAVLAVEEVLGLHPNILNSVETYHKVSINGYDAFDFADDRDGFWPEGQGHIACAYYRAGNRTRTTELLSLLPKLQQMPPPHGDGKGIVAASHDFLTSGFDFHWFRRMHVAATGWAYMALQRYNPFEAHSMLSIPTVRGDGLPSPSTFRFRLDGEIGENYRIECSPDLSTWTTVEVIQLTQNTAVRDYSHATGTERLFYRALHLPD